MQGFLQLKTHRKTWVKRWFALHTDFVLYSFKCEADDQALTATPVPGFTVTHLQVHVCHVYSRRFCDGDSS